MKRGLRVWGGWFGWFGGLEVMGDRELVRGTHGLVSMGFGEGLDGVRLGRVVWGLVLWRCEGE